MTALTASEVLTIAYIATGPSAVKRTKRKMRNVGKTALDYARENEKLKDSGALKLLEEKTGR